MRIQILLMVIVAFPLISFAGTESGGGGGLLARNSGWVLIDYLNIDLNFKEDKSSSVADLNQAQEMTKNVLKAWDQNSPMSIAALLVLTGFDKSVRWLFTDQNLEAPIRLPPGVDPFAATRIAAYYRTGGKQFTVLVNQPLWNILGLKSQMGLLTHEALRHVQIGQLKHFDEKSLQYATSILMMCRPDLRLGYYVQYLILNGPALAEKLYGPFQSVIEKNCDRSF